MPVNGNCVAHPFRPVSSDCKKCGKGICEECARLHTHLCPECAGVFIKDKGKTTGMQIRSEGPGPKPKAERAQFHLKMPTAIPHITAGLLIAIMIALLGLGLMGKGPFPLRAPAPKPEELDKIAKSSLYLAVTCIDAHQKRTGQVPESLDIIGLGADKSLDYRAVSAHHFIITSKKGKAPLTYDSAKNGPEFFDGIPPPFNPSAGTSSSN